MRVHPDFQKQGYGQKMLEALEMQTIKFGYKTLQLDTMTKQTAGRHLYEKNGYKETKTETWIIYGEPCEIVFYQKKL